MTENFYSFYNKFNKTTLTGNKVNHRHRKGYTDHDPYYSRKHQNLVPDYVKEDPEEITKIKQLKKVPHGKKLCSPSDLRYIEKNFSVIPNRNKVSKLGNTGISLSFDKKLNHYILSK